MEVRIEIRPRWPYQLPTHSDPDGVLRLQNGVIRRLISIAGEPVLVRTAQSTRKRILIGAQASSKKAANQALDRMRFALALDDDLQPFHKLFRDDPLIGRSVRTYPGLRIFRRPEPFEALAWAIVEQLIDFPTAVEIQWQLIRRYGHWHDDHQLWEPPSAETFANLAPAEIEACGLSGRRAIALMQTAKAVANGYIDLHDEDVELGWRKLLRIPNIGRWTVESLALYGQGRLDQLPAGDLHYLKIVGRLFTGNPHMRAKETEVRSLFARYYPYGGLAGAHLSQAVRHHWAKLETTVVLA